MDAIDKCLDNSWKILIKEEGTNSIALSIYDYHLIKNVKSALLIN